MVDFTIFSQGSVSEAVARASTLNDGVFEGCITVSIAGWQFTKPQGAGAVHVSYPCVAGDVQPDNVIALVRPTRSR